MPENFPNLERGKTMPVQEAQMVPIKMKPKRPALRHIITKIPGFEDKDRLSKATTEKKEVIHKQANALHMYYKLEGNGKKYCK